MKPLKSGDAVILSIGSDSYDEVVEKISASGIVTVAGKRFKEIQTGNEKYPRLRLGGMGKAENYIIFDNRDGKIEAYLNPSF